MDRHAPLVTRRVRDRPSAPWMTESVREARRVKRRSERRWRKHRLTIFRDIYVKDRKAAGHIREKAKINFYKSKIESAPNSKTLFNVANELMGAPKSKQLPTNFLRTKLPQIFCDFFSSKISKIRNELDAIDSPSEIFSSYKGVTFSDFDPVSEKDLCDLVKSCSPKSCVLDPLLSSLVKDNLDVLTTMITHIINASLLSGNVPTDFKRAVVTPLLKKTNLDVNELKNYRPVSNLSFISKILEKVVLKQCQSHLVNNNLIEINQSAYRKNHSTETAVLSVMEELLSSMDKRLVSLVALLDLSAAFDTIDHNILLSRLQHSFGFSGTVLKWFSSYLSDRTQCVSIDNVMSSPSPLKYGVPQGSVLGPVLFSLYTQPLSDIIDSHKCSYHKYADDTELSKSVQPNLFSSAQSSIQSCIADILIWMNSNKLKLNPEKTELMISGSKQYLSKVLSDSLYINGTSMPFLPQVKYLGVTLDSSLTMQRYISDVCRSTFLALRRIATIRPFLSFQSTSILLHATVTSRLDYCNSALSGIPTDQLARLQRVQNSAARLLLKKRKRVHITPLLKNLHWLPISFRITYKLAVLAFRHFDSSLPPYLSKSLTINQSSRTLRSSSEKLLKVPKVNLKAGNRSFSYSAPTVWNSLPLHLRNTNTLSLFKSRLKTHLFTCAFLD